MIKKSLILDVLILSLPYIGAQAQITPLGLDSSNITSLSISEVRAGVSHLLLAGTDSTGVFSYQPELEAPQWVSDGLENYSASDVFIQTAGIGPMDFYLFFCAVRPKPHAETPHLVYKKDPRVNTIEWLPADSGLIRNEESVVSNLTGFHFSGHEPPEPLFCALGGSVYRSVQFSNVPWDSLASFGGLVTLKSFSDSILWGGGSTVAFAPYLIKSVDKGETWDTCYPDPVLVGGDNTVYDIALDPNHPDTLYAALWSKVIMSTDGGTSWKSAGLENTDYAFFSIVVNPLDSEHILAGGADENDHFLFFETTDGGSTWQQQVPATMGPSPIAHITDMAGQVVNEKFCVFIGTAGNGVFKYQRIPSIISQEDQSKFPRDIQLEQNYPNPFNPSTRIAFTLYQDVHVTLSIYNAAGQLVETLVNRTMTAGRHTVDWNAGNLGSGIYLVRISAGKSAASRKMIFLK